MLSFMLVSVACILATRRLWLIMTTMIWAAYFLFFDTTHSARFFRIWVVFIPLMIVAISGVISRLIGKVEGPWATVLPLCLVIFLAATGIPDLFNHNKILLQNVTPPAGMLTESRYLVNGGFYQPESLIYQYPQKQFIGMPIRPEDLADFLGYYPEYRHILWHQSFNVQEKLLEFAQESPDFKTIKQGENKGGYHYQVMAIKR
jgi:hypothetical protein